MVGCGVVFGPDADDGDDQIAQKIQSLNFSGPAAGLFAVGADEFLCGKVLIGVVPVDVSVRKKVCPERVGVLL